MNRLPVVMSRSLTIEESIDKKIYKNYCLTKKRPVPHSIYLFLETIESLLTDLSQYHGQTEEKSIRKALAYLIKSFPNQRLTMLSVFNFEERNYLEDTLCYVKDLSVHLNMEYYLEARQKAEKEFYALIDKLQLSCDHNLHPQHNNDNESPRVIDFNCDEYDIKIIISKKLSKNLARSLGNGLYFLIITEPGNLDQSEYISLLNNRFVVCAFHSRQNNTVTIIDTGNPIWSAYRELNGVIQGIDNHLRESINKSIDINSYSPSEEGIRVLRNWKHALITISEELFTDTARHILPYSTRSAPKKTAGKIVNKAIHELEHISKEFKDSLIDDSLQSLLQIAVNTLHWIVESYIDEKSIYKNICCSLAQIKSLDSLYVIKNSGQKNSSELVYGEENLSGILAMGLSCLYKKIRNTSVCVEYKVGNGRADVVIKQGNDVVAIIESKLIKKNTDAEQRISEGIGQLERYSETINMPTNPTIQLFLIVFSYDRDAKSLKKKITESAKKHPNTEEIIEKDSSSIFIALKDSPSGSFSGKDAGIEVLYCPLDLRIAR